MIFYTHAYQFTLSLLACQASSRSLFRNLISFVLEEKVIHRAMLLIYPLACIFIFYTYVKSLQTPAYYLLCGIYAVSLHVVSSRFIQMHNIYLTLF